MRRTSVLFGIVLALAGAPGVAFAAEPAPVPAPAPAHPPLPPSLVGLEQKAEELKVTSLRFAAQSSVTLPRGDHQALRLLKTLGADSQISGEETFSPAAGNVTLSLFGHPFTFRVVGTATYVYIRALGRVDHGRPWIKLGRDGLAELVTEENGKPIKTSKTPAPTIGAPSLAEPPFTGLRKTLAGAEEVRETGTATLYGQPVTDFLAILEPEQIKRESLASTSRLLPPRPLPTVTMEVSLAQNGLPVRTVITTHDKGTTVAATVDIPAINFPLVIQAPPAAQTVNVAQLRKLERRARRRHHAKRKK
jgi:hypothetical protein